MLQTSRRGCAFTVPLVLVVAIQVLLAQPGTSRNPPPPPRPGEITLRDVCAAALPRVSFSQQFHWSPDGQAIAYFHPSAGGFDLHLELWLVKADGSEKKLLLAGPAFDRLFPAKPVGHKGELVPSPPDSMGFEWTPDGRGIVLYSDHQIYLLDLTTLETKPLVAGDDAISDIQLSPDGRNLAFVRQHNVQRVAITGGSIHPLTYGGSESILKGELDWLYPSELGLRHGYAWSPDSSRIAYLEFHLDGVAAYTPPFRLAEDRPPPTIDYPITGGKIPTVHLYVAEVGSHHAPIAIDTGSNENIYLPRVLWLPQGEQLAVERLNRAQTQLDLLLADPRTGRSRVVLSETDRYWINVSDNIYFLKKTPQFLWSSERTGYRHLYLYNLDGRLIRPITDGEWEVSTLDAVDEKAERVYYTSTEETPIERHLYSIGLDALGRTRITATSGTHEITFRASADAYVDRFSTALAPWVRTVYTLHPAASSAAAAQGSPHPATRVFAIDEPASARTPSARRVNFIKVATHDNVSLNALLIQPEGFSPEKKYPSVVYIAGGPGDQAVRDRWEGDVSLFQQMLLQHGYVIFALDNRGTAGRGHLFEEYLHYRFEGQELADQKDGLLFLRSLSYIDADRVGIWGRGFGGALVVNAMLHPRLQLKAGFAVAPIVNWMRYNAVFAERYLADPVANQDGYLTSSPLENADSLAKPLLVAQGSADLQVHADQAMELQHELIEAHKHAEVSLYPAKGHTLDEADACMVSYSSAFDLFAANLNGSPSP